MRTGERSGEVFDALLERGQIVLHASEVERTAALAAIGADSADDGDQLVIADTRDQVGALNAAIRDRRQRAGEPGALVSELVSGLVSPSRAVVSGSVSATGSPPDATTATSQSPTATPGPWPGSARTAACSSPAAPANATLPAEYVREHVELAFTTTAYGAQGETVDSAHLALGETTGAASAYVAHDPRPPPQHRPPRRRVRRRRPQPMGRRLQPRPRRPRTQPRRDEGR